MNQDLKFRRECEQFVLSQLGANSDDAAAYFSCADCGTRWGHLLPREQSTRTFCDNCHAANTRTAVDPHRPAWYGTTPPNYVPPFFADIDADNGDESESAKDHQPEAIGWKERGRMVHQQAQKYRLGSGKKTLGKKHIARAAKKIAAALLLHGLEIDAETLASDRRRYADTMSSARRYHQQKEAAR